VWSHVHERKADRRLKSMLSIDNSGVATLEAPRSPGTGRFPWIRHVVYLSVLVRRWPRVCAT
jgi:hypothetical protein